MECRVYYKPDKSVAVIYLAPQSKLSKEDGYKRCAEQSGIDGLPYDDIDSSDLPQSREYRNAWEGEKGKPITINTIKKSEIDTEKTKPSLEERIEILENKGD